MFYRNTEGMQFPLPEHEYSVCEKYVLFGTGEVAQSYYTQLLEIIPNDNIVFFIDSMSNEKEKYGKKIYKLVNLDRKKVNDYKYILCTFTSAVGMENELLKIGVDSKNIIKSSKYTLDSFVDFKLYGKKVCVYPKMDNIKYTKIKKKIDNYILQELSLEIDVEVEKNDDDIVNTDNSELNIVKKYDEMSSYDLILVWNKKNLQDQDIKGFDNVFCIDEKFFQYIDIKLLAWINYKLLASEKRKEIEQISQNNFQKLEQKKCSKSYVFGTGPSMENGMEICLNNEDINNVYKIVCNAAIYNKDFIKKIKPDIYVLSDSYFIDADNAELINKIVDYINNSDSYLCMPVFWSPLYIYKYNLNMNKIIGFSETKNEMFFPNGRCLKLYSKAHNVITKYAIPIASALTDIIYISGCDGAEIGENGEMIYNHSADAKQIIEKMEVLNHYAYFKQIIEFGEKKCKIYKSITNSYVPVLAARIEKI